ncbi:MAG TPA: hypothetical protein PKX47_10270 [Smithellaceae bacterium]|jgi:hypothetical protein|nr:hypothetical protein [Smithellaceae bacterium]HQN66627.1 hypothetical protein [Smithellaceae bacterium]
MSGSKKEKASDDGAQRTMISKMAARAAKKIVRQQPEPFWGLCFIIFPPSDANFVIRFQ